mmetsp:Transcript_70223/g.135554  ORF Transcript_70223/g.135554 Transcript_70223/m.135554 type:complete len:209 (+) Transcript_70223:757-1383(+)
MTFLLHSAVLFVMAAMQALSGFSWRRELTQICPITGGKHPSPFLPPRHPLGLATTENCGLKDHHSVLATNRLHNFQILSQLHSRLKNRPKSCLGGLFAIADLCREKASQLLKLLQQPGLIPHSLILRVTFLLTWQSMLTMTIWCGSGAVGRLNWQLSTKMPPARKAKTLAGPTWRQTEGAAFQKEYALLPEVPLARKAKALPWCRWRH